MCFTTTKKKNLTKCQNVRVAIMECFQLQSSNSIGKRFKFETLLVIYCQITVNPRVYCFVCVFFSFDKSDILNYYNLYIQEMDSKLNVRRYVYYLNRLSLYLHEFIGPSTNETTSSTCYCPIIS